MKRLSIVMLVGTRTCDRAVMMSCPIFIKDKAGTYLDETASMKFMCFHVTNRILFWSIIRTY